MLFRSVGINFSKNSSIAIRKAGTKRVGEVEKTDVAPSAPDTPEGSTTGGGQKPGGGVETEG